MYYTKKSLMSVSSPVSQNFKKETTQNPIYFSTNLKLSSKQIK